ncbi:MAG: indole-3-glycerol phosphate synthase TrpC [Oscillospiraceae bacterium]|nr:indole-3-glycerol phosphate synthase TrpC [Oscillospiraceae bacterium]
MILGEIVEKRKIQLEREKAAADFETVKRAAEKLDRQCISFKSALAKPDRLSVISEVKKASPSKGLIQPNFDPVKIAKEYENCGADAVSCLTEEHYFQGSSEYFKLIRQAINLPMIRKDFIIDEYQIYEARLMGADAILLIAAVLDDEKLKRFGETARSLGLDILAETHDESELERVLALDFDIIGINNRNLKTFEVTLETTARLAGMIPEGKVIVSESGIRDNADMKTVRSYRADAVLIGETLMRSGNIGATLTALRENV